MTTKKTKTEKESLSATMAFSCTPELRKKIEGLAADYERKPSWILRKIVERYFERFAAAQKNFKI